MSPTARTIIPVLAVTLALTATGCSNPDAAGVAQTASTSPQNAGEPPAPPPPTQAPSGVQRTPQQALANFVQLYINWNYKTLTATQRRLAAIAVGPARLAEQQAAAASSGDSTIRQGQIENSGAVVSIARELTRAWRWVIVTREQTSGSTQYEGLPASYHVTLAAVQHAPGGWAVSEWLPQS